jgi:hypothetical protein
MLKVEEEKGGGYGGKPFGGGDKEGDGVLPTQGGYVERPLNPSSRLRELTM